MTELAVRDQTGAEVARESLSNGVARLKEWAASAAAVNSLAHALVGTSFVPEAFRGKPDEATAAILAGAEVGLSPMASLRSFDIIQGTAAARAITLRAVVQSFGHEIILVESSATRCVMKGKRRGGTEWQTSRWSIDRARQLKLAGKPNWQNQPEAMLIARCTSEICRLVAADAILGIGYSVEEIEDAAPETTATVTRLPTTRQRAVVDVPEPPLEPTVPVPNPDAVIAPAENIEAITSAQLKKIGAAMTSLDMKDRADALAFVSGVVGRDITTRNDLTKDEASRVIDRLERLESAAEDKASAAEGAEPELTGWQS